MSRTVLHLIGADASPAMFDRFAAAAGLLADDNGEISHDFVEVGVGDAHPAGRARVDALRAGGVICSRIDPALRCRDLLSAALTERLAKSTVSAVHIWSPAALSACYCVGGTRLADWVRTAMGGRRVSPAGQANLLIDAMVLRDSVARRLFARGDRLPFLRTPQIVCESDFEAAQLAPLGVSPYECRIAIAAAPWTATLPAVRAIREELHVDAKHRLVVLIPPIERWAGAFIGAWATLVLEKLHHELRLVLPGVGTEVERLQRLVDSIQHDELVRFPGEALSFSALLTVADAALLLSDHATPRYGILAAQVAGVPILLSTPAARSADVRDGENAWVCPPAQPKLAARRLLEIMEQPEEARRRAMVGRADQTSGFNRAALGRAWNVLYDASRAPACCNSA